MRDIAATSNVDADGHFRNEFASRSFEAKGLDRLLVREGELLVVKSSGNKVNVISGKTAICGPNEDGRIVASNFMLRLRPNPKEIHPKYLWFFLNSPRSKAFVKRIVGAFTYPLL